MISSLEGKVVSVTEKSVVLVIGGIGWRIFSTPRVIESVKGKSDPVKFHTHLYQREDALELYGFTNAEELDVFELLIEAPGIGPKSALAILSAVPVTDIVSAIENENEILLTKISGIGRKTALKIILELKPKLAGRLGKERLAELAGPAGSADGEAIDALVALGYSLYQARHALKETPREITDVGEKIKTALRYLGKK